MRPLLLPKGSAGQQPARQTEGISLTHALLAQLVEQLTLNQRAQGSSPWKCTIEVTHEQGREQSFCSCALKAPGQPALCKYLPQGSYSYIPP